MTSRWAWPVRFLLAALLIAAAAVSNWPHLDFVGLIGLTNDALPGGVDKWVHVTAFAALLPLLVLARLVPWRLPRTLAFWSLLLAMGAVAAELIQGFVPGREVSAGDMIASQIGVALGAGIVAFIAVLCDPTDDFVGHARLMSVLTLASRVLGLVRDWALAFLFGFGGVYDAFAVAFVIPNLFRRLFGEGALAAAFIPHYTKLDKASPADGASFAARVLRWMWLVLGGLAVVSAVIVAALYLSGRLDERGTLAAGLTLVSIWYMPLVCIAAILGAMLQVHGRFGVPSASPVVLNVFIIVAALVAAIGVGRAWSLETRAYVVLGAVVLSGVVQLLWHQLALRRAGVFISPLPLGEGRVRASGSIDQPTRSMLRQWAPTALTLGVFQINTMIDMLIAMFFSGEPGATLRVLGHDVEYPMRLGAVAILGSAARLYEFPLGVFGIAIATAIFPALSRAADDRDAFVDLLRRGLRLTMFIGLPAAVGLILVRQPLAQAIYASTGRIEATDSARVAWVLLGYAPAVWAYSMNHLLLRAFYAHHDSIRPMRLTVVMVLLNVVLNLILIWLPAPANPVGDRLGAAGLAWATAICAVLQSVILLVMVRRYAPRPVDRAVLVSWLKMLVVTAAMALAVVAAMRYAAGLIDVQRGSRSGAIVQLLAGVGAGAVVVLIGAWAFRMAELRWIFQRRDQTLTADKR